MSRNFWIALAAFLAPLAVLALAPDLPGILIGVLTFLAVAGGWVVGLCLHEFGHAYVAWRGGDHTVPGRGYLTLDPLKYAHPVLSIVLPLAFILMGGIGFPGAAVSLRPDLLRSRTWRTLTALAGPAGTLVFLIALGVPFLIGLPERMGPMALWAALAILAFMLATSFVLNLLPLPGFDGYAAVRPFIRGEAGRYLSRIDAHPGAGLLIMMLIFFVPGVSAALIGAGLFLTQLLGIERLEVALGLSAFRFWER